MFTVFVNNIFGVVYGTMQKDYEWLIGITVDLCTCRYKVRDYAKYTLWSFDADNVNNCDIEVGGNNSQHSNDGELTSKTPKNLINKRDLRLKCLYNRFIQQKIFKPYIRCESSPSCICLSGQNLEK